MRTFLKLYDRVLKTLADCGKLDPYLGAELNITPAMYGRLQALVSVLEPFAKATQMSGSKAFVTLHLIPKWILSLKQSLASDPLDNSYVALLKSKLLASLTIRVSPIIDEVSLALMASALDPRDCELEYLNKPGLADDVWKAIEAEVVELNGCRQKPNGEMVVGVMAGHASSLVHNFRSHCHLNCYLWKQQLDFSIIGFWKEHQSEFAELARVVRALYCIPATSTNCERAFSVAGLIFMQKRMSMKPETLEVLSFIRGNFPPQYSLSEFADKCCKHAMDAVRDDQL